MTEFVSSEEPTPKREIKTVQRQLFADLQQELLKRNSGDDVIDFIYHPDFPVFQQFTFNQQFQPGTKIGTFSTSEYEPDHDWYQSLDIRHFNEAVTPQLKELNDLPKGTYVRSMITHMRDRYNEAVSSHTIAELATTTYLLVDPQEQTYVYSTYRWGKPSTDQTVQNGLIASAEDMGIPIPTSDGTGGNFMDDEQVTMLTDALRLDYPKK